MSPRRRPKPLGDSGPKRASESITLRVVEVDNTLTTSHVASQLFLGGFARRRMVVPFAVEIVDRATGDAVAAEPVDGTAGQAHGLMTVMSADLDRMDVREFLRKWGRPQR